MTLQLANSTLVIAGRHFNPSIVRDHWLVTNGIMAPHEFGEGCVFTDVMVQVHSREFHLLIVPDQCQFTPRVPADKQPQLIADKVGRVVQTLPHTPFLAVGLNFHWHLTPEHVDAVGIGRRLFFVPGGPLHIALDGEDLQCGGYLSKDFRQFRMKLNVRPAIRKCSEADTHFIEMSFNYHLDLASTSNEPAGRVQAIEGAIQRWGDASDHSMTLANTVAELDAP